MVEEYTDEQLREQIVDILKRADDIQWELGDWTLRCAPVGKEGVKNGSLERLKKLYSELQEEWGSIPAFSTFQLYRVVASRFPLTVRNLGPYTVYTLAYQKGLGPEDITNIPHGSPEGRWSVAKMKAAVIERNNIAHSDASEPKSIFFGSNASNPGEELPGAQLEPEPVQEIKGSSREVPQTGEPEPDEPDDEPPVYRRKRRPKQDGTRCPKCWKQMDEIELGVAIDMRRETGGRTLCNDCRMEFLTKPTPKTEPEREPDRIEPGEEPGDDAEWKQFMDTLYESTEKMTEAAVAIIALKFSDERYEEMLSLIETVDEDIRAFHKWGQNGKGRLRIVS